MKSLPGKFASARGGTLLLILLLGAGLFVAACGDEEVPAPTTPAPPPPPVPEPEPEPESPAVPVGLMISATGLDFIEWSWTPVEDVSGYDVQYSANQAFTDEDEVIARTAEEFSYRREGLDPETSGYLRVRSASGTEDDRVTSDWSTHVTGTTMAAPPPPEPPAMPTGFMVSDATETSITWTWNAVEGATGYVVQVSMDEIFDDTILGNPETKLFDDLPFTTDTSYTAADLDPETTLYARVAAGAGTPTAPLVSAFTVHATGMTMAARLAAPANLEVKSRGHNFIEWQWDEVEGADGYQPQFSTDAGFSDPDNPLERPGVSNTSARVDNLESEADGYLRVRAYRGTLAARMFGDWSEPDEATTEEAPPPEPLDAPENVRTSNVEDDSITLIWDEVDEAETYEVEFREEGASTWDDADCGDDSNVVTEEECVATGLDAATDYEFRVRGVPVDDDDDAHLVGAWSDIEDTRTDGTATRSTTPTTSGGMGNLNLRWESTATRITWIWDRVAGKKYDIYAAQIAYNDSANPCENVTYAPMDSSATSHPLTVTAGQVALACVRTANPDNPSENLSFAWAAATPVAPSVSEPATRARDTDKDTAADMTTALLWEGFAVKAGFNYAYRVVADPHGNGEIDGDTDADDVQAACDAGTALGDGESDVDFTDDNIVLARGLKTFTGYLLCARYSNTAGTSGWAVPGANAEAYTRPAKPSSPTVYTSLVDEMPTTTAVVWRVATRGRDGLPRLAPGYTVRTMHHLERTANDAGTGTVPIKAPTAATCGVDSADAVYNRTPVVADDIDNDADGIVISPGTAFNRPAAYSTDTANPTPPQERTGNRKVYVCVQANSTDTLTGPWVLSSAYTVKQQ